MSDALLRDEKGRLLPGTPPGPGRPKGSGMSLKEYASRKFKEMAEEEKETFIKDIAKDIIWKMAEGNPESKTDLTSGGEKITGINYITPNGDNSAPNAETTPGV